MIRLKVTVSEYLELNSIYRLIKIVEDETDLVEGCVHIYDPADIRNEVFLQPKEKAVLWGDRLMKRESNFDNEEYLKTELSVFLSEPFGRVR